MATRESSPLSLTKRASKMNFLYSVSVVRIIYAAWSLILERCGKGKTEVSDRKETVQPALLRHCAALACKGLIASSGVCDW